MVYRIVKEKGDIGLSLGLFLAVSCGLLLWVFLSVKSKETQEQIAEPKDGKIFEVATASDPYLRSIQGAQEARLRLNQERGVIEQELQ